QNLISDGTSTELIALGGRYYPYGRCFLGPDTVRAVRNLLADKAVLSGPPALAYGQLYNPDPLDAEVKRAMIEQARESLLLFSTTILPRRGLTAVASLSAFSHFVTTDITEREAAEIAALDVTVLRV